MSEVPLKKAESNKSENVKPNSAPKKDSNKKELYFDEEEVKKQNQLWSDSEKIHPWHDAPTKVKVTVHEGICLMIVEMTIGMPPDGVYSMFAAQTEIPYFQMDKFGRQLLEIKSRKFLKKYGSKETVETENALAWNFLWWSGSIPIKLIVEEEEKYHLGYYKKEKMMFMKVFEGQWKLKPIFVDQERFCKNRLPKSREEYKRCSGGEGRLATKVRFEQIFKPYFPLNLPPFSWYIRAKTIETTKTLLKMIQDWGTQVRRAQ